MGAAVERDRFEELVARALASLPDEIARQIDNVDVQVQEWPTNDQAGAVAARGGMLLGLYVGVPLTRRSSGYGLVLPDRIIIFQRPLEMIARDEDDLVERVRETVVHEVAHHFGISDERLRQIEAERRPRR